MKMESLRKSRFRVSKKELSVEIGPRVTTIRTTLDVHSEISTKLFICPCLKELKISQSAAEE